MLFVPFNLAFSLELSAHQVVDLDIDLDRFNITTCKEHGAQQKGRHIKAR